MKRIIRYGVRALAVLTAVLTLAGCSVFNNDTPAAAKNTTQAVYQGNLLLGLSADGRITLPVTGLDFSVGGIIKAIYISPGDRVKQGDLLAELDDADLQLALKTAQNNLDKAVLAYEEAVASADYNIKSEKINLAATRRQMNETFDDYSYRQTIESAELTLERRMQDFRDTAVSTGGAEEAARLTLIRREADADAALAALKEAEAELAETEAAVTGDYDLYTYQNKIDAAQNAVNRTRKTLNDAKQELRTKREDYEADLYSSVLSVARAAAEAVAPYENAVYNAQNNYDDALKELEVQKAGMENFTRSESGRLRDAVSAAQKTVDNAVKNVESANQSVTDAQTALSGALTDGAQKLAAARQSIADAETSLAKAHTDLTRGENSFVNERNNLQGTYDLQALKLENLANSDSGIRNALYNIEEAKNALASAENNLAKIKITAPIDGEVLNVSKKVGERVTETQDAVPGVFMGTSGASSSLITIRDLSEIYLNARIPEGDIVGLSVGQAIRVAVDALGEEDISATVYSISSIPATDSSGIITYEVIGVLDEFNPDIRDSMSVFLTFIKREKMNVLLVPNRSVFIENGQQYVYVQTPDGVLEKRAVVCGLSNGTQTEVTEGLERGETVVVGKVTL